MIPYTRLIVAVVALCVTVAPATALGVADPGTASAAQVYTPADFAPFRVGESEPNELRLGGAVAENSETIEFLVDELSAYPYLVKTHATLERPLNALAPAAGRFTVWVNGRAAISVAYESAMRADGQPGLSWRNTSLPQGSLSGLTLGQALDLQFWNYAQFGSVRPGINELTFTWTGPLAGLAVLSVSPESGVEATTHAMPTMAVSLQTRMKRSAGSSLVRLDWSISPQHWPARRVRVEAIVAGDGLPELRRTSWLGTVTQPASGSFEFELHDPGQRIARVVVLASNQPTKEARVQLDTFRDPARPGSGSTLAAVGSVGAIGLILAVWRGTRRAQVRSRFG